MYSCFGKKFDSWIFIVSENRRFLIQQYQQRTVCWKFPLQDERGENDLASGKITWRPAEQHCQVQPTHLHTVRRGIHNDRVQAGPGSAAQPWPSGLLNHLSGIFLKIVETDILPFHYSYCDHPPHVVSPNLTACAILLYLLKPKRHYMRKRNISLHRIEYSCISHIA